MSNSRRIASHLNVHSVIDPINKYLHLTLRLHVTSHYTKDKYWLAISGNKRRDNGMERAAYLAQVDSDDLDQEKTDYLGFESQNLSHLVPFGYQIHSNCSG